MADLQAQETKQESIFKLQSLVDKLIVASVFLFIVAVASFIVYTAFGRAYPEVKMATAALTSFLLVLIAIPFIVHYVRVAWEFGTISLNANDSEAFLMLAMGTVALCVSLAVIVVNSIVYSNTLDTTQDILLFLEFIMFGFQLHRILFRQSTHD